jgi:4-alpha-glucanotransferase
MEHLRAGGILLHPTSLPGPYGIGDLGPHAHAFIDWLADSGCGLWQVLPLGPTGYGNSPYQCHSVFAGNPNLISPDLLVRDGYLTDADVRRAVVPLAAETGRRDRVDYGRIIPLKRGLLTRAYERFREGAGGAQRAAFDDFRAENAAWLDDYSIYMALKQKHGGRSWLDWDEVFREGGVSMQQRLDPALHEAALEQAFSQMLFFTQWRGLLQHAHERGILLVGDVPIFAAADSSDVWAHPELFCLDDMRLPAVVAGVPPDYFAPTGQLWGNPLYRWEEHKRGGYAWWIERLRAMLSLVDVVRMDHFRGIAAYWEVPASAPTAEHGRWMPGPGASFLAAVLEAGLGQSNSKTSRIIAEDLGVVTPDVRFLLDKFGLPGMRVLQFGLAGHSDEFLPHNYVPNCIAYTGTHDNDTARGWFDTSPESDQRFALKYLESTAAEVVAAMIRSLWSSLAMWAVVPMQDLLDLGPEARMNYPGRAEGNWAWRLREDQLTLDLSRRLAVLNGEFRRVNRQPQ